MRFRLRWTRSKGPNHLWHLNCNGLRVATLQQHIVVPGWFWYAYNFELNIKAHNTATDKPLSLKHAKAAALVYVQSQLPDFWRDIP